MGKRGWMLLILGVAALGILVLVQFYTPAVSTASWGLHFGSPGQPPTVSADQKSIDKLDGLYLGDTREKVLYLTFDAGYENGCTAQILDTLQKHRVPAAFFLVGNYMQKNPDLVRRMVAEGHIVGNHTMHHYDMDKLTDKAAFCRELTDLEGLFLKITGKEMPKYYRPPRGEYSRENLRHAQELGYRTVFWSLAYVDWNNDAQPSREQAFAKLLPRTHNGAVVLLHSTSKTNAAILDELLSKWEQAGYRFASLDQAFAKQKSDRRSGHFLYYLEVGPERRVTSW